MTNETKIIIIENELTAYENTMYQLQLRSRVAKITDNAELEKNIEGELVKCLKAIDFLNEEKNKL